ncbi:MAG: VanZ family protein [Candidatus Edwardsbacteria bacterium]|nr:VanZ family protein [Candidatus Edwardsbacteria bacterium]
MRRWTVWAPWAAWTALMVAFSSIPRLRPPALLEGWDAVFHLVQFAGFGLLLYRPLARHGADARRACWLTLAVSAAMAAAYEGHKLMVPGRHTYPYDYVTDLFGALAGLGLAQFIRGRNEHGEVPGDQGHL